MGSERSSNKTKRNPATIPTVPGRTETVDGQVCRRTLGTIQTAAAKGPLLRLCSLLLHLWGKRPCLGSLGQEASKERYQCKLKIENHDG
jgi:hypothetical protein